MKTVKDEHKCFGKLRNKAVHRQMVHFLETNCILNKQQHGIRSNKSTGSAIFSSIREIWYNYILTRGAGQNNDMV